MCTSLSTNSLSRSSFLRSRGSRAILLNHVALPFCSTVPFWHPFLEIQSALARCLGERLDAAVIKISAAIEHHVGDALLLGARRNQLADSFGGVDTGPGLD